MIGHDLKPFRSKVSQGNAQAETQPRLAIVSVNTVTFNCNNTCYIVRFRLHYLSDHKEFYQTSVKPDVYRMQLLMFVAQLLLAVS